MTTTYPNHVKAQQIGRCAIVTAFTPNFDVDFKVFLDSIRRITKIPIVAISLGHSDAEFEKLQNLDVQILRVTDTESKPLQEIGVRWPQWSKPFFIKKAIRCVHLDSILWIDVDTVILDDLKPLFDHLLRSFFVVSDYFSPKDCKNDDRLYEEYPTPLAAGKEDVVLNSGVIGLCWPRDKSIINDWIKKIKIVTKIPHLQDYISLYDQGVLLWVMRDLGILDKILSNPTWNHKAIKNCYELEGVTHKWPLPPIPRMGGDIIDEIKLDNPNAVIAHFAGIPKLSQLCVLNSPQPCQFRINKYQEVPATKVFGIGIERAGTHTLAEMLRRGCRTENWIRHEFEPSLSYEALTKWQGKSYDTDILKDRLDLYNRQDVQFIAEINHRLGFFIPEIRKAVPDAKFVLLLRNPLTLVRSRLLNFSGWTKELHRFAACYQFDAYSLHTRFGSGSEAQNRYRLQPTVWDLNPIEMHVWEVVETLRFILRDLRKLPGKDYKIIWIEDFAEAWKQLEDLIPITMYWIEARKLENVHFGAKLPCSKQTTQWINDQIDKHADFIINSISEVLHEFDVIPHKPSS